MTLVVLLAVFIWTQQGVTAAEEGGGEGVKCDTKITTYKSGKYVTVVYIFVQGAWRQQ